MFADSLVRRTIQVAICLALVLLVSSPIRAEARQLARIGVGGCGAQPSVVRPGATVRVIACFVEDGAPIAAERAVFVEHGPAPSDAVVAVTTDAGEASVELTAMSPGVSLVSACVASVCTPPLRIVWSAQGDDPGSPAGGHPPIAAPADGATDLEPKIEGFDPVGSSVGKRCKDDAPADIPAFIDIADRSTRPAAHPKTGLQVTSHIVRTGSPMLPGSVIYQVPTLVVLLSAEASAPIDDTDSLTRGANRALAFFSHGDSRIGKFEMAYDGQRWIEVPASFTVVAAENDVEFFPDDKPIGGRVAALTRADGACDSIGTLTSGGGSRPSRGPAISAGVLILLLMGALTAAILRSSEPPSKGIVIEHPAGPPVGFERSDVIYDGLGRPLGFVDIVETPDGGTHTIRGSIAQEGLVLEAPDVLDPSDWEDETLAIQRTDMQFDGEGRVSSFWEIVSSRDGTSQRSHIRSVGYSPDGRVVRFERAVEILGADDSLSFRTEMVSLTHEGSTNETSTKPELAVSERVHRSDLRYDPEGHVIGAVCSTATDGAGELIGPSTAQRLEVPVPQPMWWAGVGFGDVPVVVSDPNTGIWRLRRVLTRWFRAHGCRVTLVVSDSLGNALADMPIRFGGHTSHVDRKGHQTFWVLKKGNYAVTTIEGFLPGATDDSGAIEERFVTQDLIGWVCVTDIPGSAEARLVVSIPAARSRVSEP